MKDDHRGPELIQIASRHGLDTYAFGGDPEFIVIGSEKSIRNLGRLMDRLEDLLSSEETADAGEQAP
ncbi:MAG TPA: hypothetical protein ENK43_00620 [Planctomycetes bacterium]|nr:hypothetical protein [Planctomycetota bacterium]